MSSDEKTPWPAMSLERATAQLCAPGARFELHTVVVDGREILSWRNQPPTLSDLAFQARKLHAQKEFIVHQDERVTYDMWFRAVAALSRALLSYQVRPGDRVAIAMRNLPEWPVALFAIAAVGAIAVPLNAWWTGPELTYGLQDSGARLLIADAARWSAVRPHLDELPQLEHVWVARPSDAAMPIPAVSLESIIGAVTDYASLPDQNLPAVAIAPESDLSIFYTSGTTGRPKGAVGSHRNMLTCSLSNAFSQHRSFLRRGLNPLPGTPKTILLAIPFFHVTGCHSTMISGMLNGNKLVLLPKWDTRQALGLIERERITTAGGVPALAWQLVEADRGGHDLSSLEIVTYGGAFAAPELVRRISSDLDAFPATGWGMTETSATFTHHMAEDYLNRPGSCGPALPLCALKVVDPATGEELPVGEVGELYAYGPQIVRGYWNSPEATAATFADGWVRTGDLARLDEEGFCFIVDRIKDIVIRGGENIYSIEVESALYDHPAVLDAAVVGIPHRILGEEPAAIVQCAAGFRPSESELQQWVRERLAAFKVPVRILFCDDPLPRNANGKILKNCVQEQLAQIRMVPE
ncbi:MAG: fatty acid--CoA ligase [Sphingopyxis macrogoltabida]|uniref:3-methylmercaptopropionyl-CoA ligase n=1 Tax=Sphingopyxis macrogoltabida TaxID=33050 RepID=A0A2W5L5M4_SPHMC|nr:MAG: fatty acid--CoA ligase [Sphingopyxis macrogoltabida]